MRKILFINPLTTGGIAHYTLCLCNELINFDQVILFTSFGHNEYAILKPNFKIIRALIPPQKNKILKLFSIFYNYLVIYIYLVLANIKNIHFQWLISNTYDSRFINFLNRQKINTILTIHNMLPHESLNDSVIKNKFKKIYNSFSHLIVPTDSSLEELQNQFLINKEKITISPHGNYLFFRDFSAELNKSAACKQLNLDPEKFYILFFGYIRDYKGLDLAIEALSKIDNKNICLIIAGQSNGNDFDKYQNQISQLGLNQRVLDYIKYIDFKDVPQYYDSCDCVIFPYRHINQSGAVQIAYAFKKPIIAFNINGLKKAIKNNVTGILVDPFDTIKFASAIMQVYNDKNLANQLGKNGYQYSKDELNWKSIAEKTDKLYI